MKVEIPAADRLAAEGAIVVVGAARGMGNAVAHALARPGRKVVLGDVDEEPLTAVADTLAAGGASVATVPGDLASPEYARALLQAVGEEPIAVLVQAAGLSPTMANGPRIFDVNFTATRRLVEVTLPRMASGGVTILFSSLGAQLVAGGMFDRVARGCVHGDLGMLARLMVKDSRVSYPFSKRVLQLYVAEMASAFGAQGARIVSVSPGIINTRMGRQERESEAVMERMIDLTAAGRLGEAGEVAAVVAFLASDAARYITGTDILVDGGTVAGVTRAGGVRKIQRSSRPSL